MITDKRTKNLKKYRFCLEDIVFLKDEKIIFATIDKDSYLSNGGSKSHDGQELNYILIFAINDAGVILWDQVISLNWKSHPKPDQNSFCKVSEFQKTINIKSVGDLIECDYLFDDKINYFEVEGGEIVNKKETKLKNKESSSYGLNFQYEKAFFWYGNFLFQ